MGKKRTRLSLRVERLRMSVHPKRSLALERIRGWTQALKIQKCPPLSPVEMPRVDTLVLIWGSVHPQIPVLMRILPWVDIRGNIPARGAMGAPRRNLTLSGTKLGGSGMSDKQLIMCYRTGAARPL